MNITVIGTGYVGLVCGVCFAYLGYDVACIDVDPKKIDMLNRGVLPIYEIGLKTMFDDVVKKGRIKFCTSLKEHLHGDRVIFCCVGTPQNHDGSANIEQVLSIAKEVGCHIENDGVKILITKSTVPIGTSKKIKEVINNELNNRNIIVDFDVASNPEFLKEGDALNDFMNPDRVVIGVSSEKTEKCLRALYSPIIKGDESKLVVTNIESSEMIKYASNSMLATRISFVNEISNLCEKVGANIDDVSRGMGCDTRIGSKFLKAGCGYGGSCFPKDIRALIHTGNEYGVEMSIFKSVDETNEKQKHILFKKIVDILDIEGISGKKIAIWGLSFKPNTDDMRDAPSLTLISDLLEHNACIYAYDPLSMDNCKKIVGDSVHFVDDKYKCIENADALIIVTEWGEFKSADIDKIYQLLNSKIIVDGRNIFNKQDMLKRGFIYKRIG